MPRGRVVLATRSPGKIRELRPLLTAAGFDVNDLATLGISETPEEDDLEQFATFDENALAKARYFFARTGRPSIADDSGIEVLALGGAPGVRSKRWSERPELDGQALDDANNALLQERLAGVHDRRARYVCVAAYVDGSREWSGRGETTGVITTSPRGDGGFGYDPWFLSDELGRTFAEVSREEKARVSHRARAIAALLRALGRG